MRATQHPAEYRRGIRFLWRWRPCPRRHTLACLLLFATLLPAALSPTAPISVYGYIAARYLPALTPPVYASHQQGLEVFLRSPDQVKRYREELLEDLAEPCSGKLFVIVQQPNGELAHRSVRTWHGWLPENTPDPLRAWLDRKEFPWLPDLVRLWNEGHTVVARGHYHAYGGGPSTGDRIAQEFSELPEIVVSNGVVPSVYVRGELLHYGADVNVAHNVFRSLRTLERSLTMATGEIPALTERPSEALKSFLAYLRDYRGVNIESRLAVAQETKALCESFKYNYENCFPNGITALSRDTSPDKENMLRNLTALHGWAGLYSSHVFAD